MWLAITYLPSEQVPEVEDYCPHSQKKKKYSEIKTTLIAWDK